MAINSFHVGRLSAYAGKNERGDNGENPPWRGYCWGSDFPRARLSRQASCICLDLSWLCYHASIYWNIKFHKGAPDGR